MVGFAFKDAITNGFAEVIRNSRKIDIISGSLESGSDRILELMRKGFNASSVVEFINYVNELYPRRLYTIIIAGFLTEGLSDIRETLEVLKKINPTYVDIYRYTDSVFVNSHMYRQLNPITINMHAKIYKRVLDKRKVGNYVMCDDYVYNNKLSRFSK